MVAYPISNSDEDADKVAEKNKNKKKVVHVPIPRDQAAEQQKEKLLGKILANVKVKVQETNKKYDIQWQKQNKLERAAQHNIKIYKYKKALALKQAYQCKMEKAKFSDVKTVVIVNRYKKKGVHYNQQEQKFKSAKADYRKVINWQNPFNFPTPFLTKLQIKK